MSFIIDPYRFAAAGGAQLLNEQFEAPGATGWVSQTTAPYSGWNDLYTPAIVGSRSALISSASTSRVNAYKNFAAVSACYMRFQFSWFAPALSGNGTLCTLRDASGNILATIGIASTSNIFRAITGTGGANNAVTAPPVNTPLYGWLEFVKGTGNAIVRVGWSTTGARPAWPTTGASGALIVQTTGTANADAARVMFGTTASTVNYNYIIDDIQIQATPFA